MVDNYDYCDEQRIGIPIYIPQTFMSDFISQHTNYINIPNNNSYDSKNYLSFTKIIYRNNKYYINSNHGELYVGSDFTNLKKINISNVFIFDVSKDGNTIVFTIDNQIYLYNFKTETKDVIELNIHQDENNKYIKEIMFTPDNNHIIFSQNEHLYVWNIQNNKFDDIITTDVITFTADDNYILISNYDKFIIYDMNCKKNVYNKSYANNIIKKMKIINNIIIIGFIDGYINIINYKMNSISDMNSFQYNYSGIKCISISENNNYMACVDTNDMLSVFDIKTQQHIFTLNVFRVNSIIITDNLEIIGTGHFNSISHFIPSRIKTKK